MKSTVVTGLAVAVLIGCSAGNSAVAPGVVNEVTFRHARADAGYAKKALVYVSQEAANTISVFALNGQRVGTISMAMNYPQGLFADAHGTLYVANRGASNVLEFKRGASSPFKTLRDGTSQPEDVTVCPDGTVYVANILGASGGAGDVAVYAHRSLRPTRRLSYLGGFFFFLACDAQGNLFGTAVVGTGGTVIEFPKGQQRGAAQLPIFWGGNPAGIAVDAAGNLLVAGQSAGVEEFTETGSPTGLQIATVGLNEITLNPNGTLLLGSTGNGAVSYAFPGGTQDQTYGAGGAPIGAAFDPGTN